MNEVFRVNDWRVYKTETGYQIVNRVRAKGAVYHKDSNRYVFDSKTKSIPKTIDNFIKKELGLISTARQSNSISYRSFGIEIECYHPTNSRIREEVSRAIREAGIECTVEGYTHTVMRRWKIVTDSSIWGGCGLEVVSPILYGEEGLEELKKVVEVLNRLGCRVNRSTGLHIHHDANDLGQQRLRNIFELYRDNEDLFDKLVSNSRRAGNRFCQSLKDYPRSVFPDTRYTKVNHRSYLKYGTIEFRQHQGTLNFDKMVHWIKLTQRVVERAGDYRDRFSNLDQLVLFLGLEGELSWYLERAEELSA